MIKRISDYVDLLLSDKYASKHPVDGYELDVGKIDRFDKSDFLDYLYENDKTLRDFVLNRMQLHINESLAEKYSNEKEIAFREDHGLKLIQLSNGDVMVSRRGAA